MYYKGWDVNDPVTNGNVWFKEINTRYCVPKSDFGDASKLYQISDVQEQSLKIYGHLLKCTDSDLSIFGNYDTSKAVNLLVVFEKCDQSVRTCKSEEAINQWMQYKYIATMTNVKSFI